MGCFVTAITAQAAATAGCWHSCTYSLPHARHHSARRDASRSTDGPVWLVQLPMMWFTVVSVCSTLPLTLVL